MIRSIRSILHRGLLNLGRTLAISGIRRPFIKLLNHAIKEVPGTPSESQAPLTLLALQPNRFRSELELLSETGRFRVLTLNLDWHKRIMSLFWPPDLFERISVADYINPSRDSEVEELRGIVQAFLRRVLPPVIDVHGIDGVLGAATHYKEDVDWAAIFEALDVPFIVLHRENLLTNEGHRNYERRKGESFGSFTGSLIIVHNEFVREAYISAGFVEPEDIKALGCMRMDDYINSLPDSAEPVAEGRTGRVTLFSFKRGTGLVGVSDSWPEDPSVGLSTLFKEVHGALARLAADRPDIEVVVKTKFGDIWFDEVERAMIVDGSHIPENVKITADTNPHELIRSSDVVVGYGSTALLEAAIAGRRVVYPYFGELERDVYKPFVHFEKELHIFDVAKSSAEVRNLVEEALEIPGMPASRLRESRRIFERYVSPMDAKATERYAMAIEEAIEARGGS